MKIHQIEAWVLSVVDQAVENGSHAEDSRVELKREFPDPQTAARQIAGHSNAAKGAAILWIVGVDEKEKVVVGADNVELANWFPRVKSYFDGVTPALTDLNVPVGDKIVVGLLFQTERAPFVVKNPMNGKEGGGPVEWEVPWREGRQTRTARREQLIRLLAPLVYVPNIDCLNCMLSLNGPSGLSGKSFNLHSVLFIAMMNEEKIVVPFYKINIQVSQGENVYKNWHSLRLGPPMACVIDSRSNRNYVPDSYTAQATQNEVVVSGSGTLHLEASCAIEEVNEDLPFAINVSFHVVGHDSPIVIGAVLEARYTGAVRWFYRNPTTLVE